MNPLQNPSDESPMSTAEPESNPSSTPTQTPTTSSPTSQTTALTTGNNLTRGGHDGQAIMTKRNKTSLDRFEDSIGGRENLIDTLALANLDKKQEHFLRLLCDPARQRDSLVTIARDCGLLPVHVLDMFRHASFAKAN